MSTNAPRVVILDSHIHSFGDGFAQERAAWEALGAEVVLAQCHSAEELIDAGKEADVLVYLGLYTPFTAEVLAQLPRCRVIARFGIGMDSVDLDAATQHGIVIANAAEFCVAEVADHTAALILNMGRRITMFDRFMRQGHWQDAVNQTGGPLVRLSTQTVGLVGFGRIARRVAHNLANLFPHKLAYDPYVQRAQADAFGVEMVAFEELLERSDYVSIHTPLLPQTRGLMGAAEFARMKPTAYLINTSRGPVVDEAALIHALETGQIAGAGLDVFDQEPLDSDSPLRRMEQVVLTPHVAANSVQSRADIRAAVTETVARAIRGEWPRHVMNPNVTPRVALREATDA